MTCIAAIKTGKSIWIGGDSAGVAGYSIVTRSDKKVYVKADPSGNNFGFGFTSSFRMGQLIQYHLHIPTIPKNIDLHEYMATDFIESIRSCLKEGGFTQIENNQESGGTFIVGVKGRLFTIDSDFQVGEDLPDYAACGCGGSIALGSFFTTDKLKPKPKPQDRVVLALQAAAEFSAGVRGPFNIMQVT